MRRFTSRSTAPDHQGPAVARFGALVRKGRQRHSPPARHHQQWSSSGYTRGPPGDEMVEDSQTSVRGLLRHTKKQGGRQEPSHDMSRHGDEDTGSESQFCRENDEPLDDLLMHGRN
ncbi:hypothetical protein VNO77_37719 [Canavalia gladiata]|uniref:Uncharacterized protein n=1 Tax=Canavalia gladiata TaxID=3824 RepID=A0AAN9KAT3_CANGL